MKLRKRWIPLLVALAGISTCLLGVGVFVWTILSNTLPWNPDATARDYYLEVGEVYSQGFLMGFFLCFFLVLLALLLGSQIHEPQPGDDAPSSHAPARSHLKIVEH